MAGPLDDRHQFGAAMLLLATALGFTLDEAVIGVYWHALKSLTPAIRQQAFHQALDRRWFQFPRPAELKALAAEIVQTQRRAAYRDALVDCPHPHQWEDHDGKLARCACWHRATAAMAAVGAPIALPPSQTEDL